MKYIIVLLLIAFLLGYSYADGFFEGTTYNYDQDGKISQNKQEIEKVKDNPSTGRIRVDSGIVGTELEVGGTLTAGSIESENISGTLVISGTVIISTKIYSEEIDNTGTITTDTLTVGGIISTGSCSLTQELKADSATFTNTVYANAFVGDGSLLTGVSGASFDTFFTGQMKVNQEFSDTANGFDTIFELTDPLDVWEDSSTIVTIDGVIKVIGVDYYESGDSEITFHGGYVPDTGEILRVSYISRYYIVGLSDSFVRNYEEDTMAGSLNVIGDLDVTGQGDFNNLDIDSNALVGETLFVDLAFNCRLAGGLPFTNSGGQTNFFMEGINGYVGFGTLLPDEKIHVYGNNVKIQTSSGYESNELIFQADPQGIDGDTQGRIWLHNGSGVQFHFAHCDSTIFTAGVLGLAPTDEYTGELDLGGTGGSGIYQWRSLYLTEDIFADSATFTNNVYCKIFPTNDTWIYNTAFDSCAYTDTFTTADSFCISNVDYELLAVNWVLGDTEPFEGVWITEPVFGVTVVEWKNCYYVMSPIQDYAANTIKLRGREK